MVVGLDVFQINDRGNDIAHDLGGPDHVSQKLSLAVGSGRYDFRNWAAMTRNPQRLARFVHSFNQAKTLGLEFGDGNIIHNHYFIYGQ
jgi:hypothetical protein